VFAGTIICLVAGLAGGLFLTIRFLPPLAHTDEGVIATWLVRVLLGLGTAWTVVQIYLAIHAYAVFQPQGAFGVYARSEILTHAVESILMPGAIVVGLAAVVFLLAPTEAEPEDQTRGPVQA
jgi:hypothetical protein